MLFKAAIEPHNFWSPTYFHCLRNSRIISFLIAAKILGKPKLMINKIKNLERIFSY
uniref:Uncharacterized protein n=1 Tax=Setaria italica TaxID=4555 RepID=K3Z2X7_SETIT